MLNKRIISKSISFVLIFVIGFMNVPNVSAAGALTNLSDATSREKVSVLSDHVLKFTTTANGVAAGQKIQVDFQAASTYSATTVTSSDMTVTWGPSTGIENILTLGGAAAGATWGVSASALQVVVTSATGVITANSKVIVTITNKVTNPSTPATYVNSVGVYTAGSVLVDTGKIADVVVADDQVVVSANIDPSLTFSIDSNATAFGTLSSASITTASPNINLTIGTNANSGYSVRVKDQGNGITGGLYNSGLSYLITSGSTLLANGSEGYGIQAASGTATISAPFTATGNNVGALTLAAQSLASYASATASNQTVTVTHKAAASTVSKPGGYNDTITYLVTGNF